MSGVQIPAFAKINLRLDILGRRADGYHELRTIFQTISLHDSLKLDWAVDKRVHLSIEGANLGAGPENLVWLAIEAARRELKLKRGVQAWLIKRIPIARGLGGGSSDAAAALIGMLRLSKKRIPLERLIEIGASLGADVPFFLFGGRALGVGRGDELYPLPDLPRRSILVVSPANISVPTKDAYAWVSRGLTKRAPASKIAEFCALCWSPLWGPLANDFEVAVFRRHPRLKAIAGSLLRHGAADAALAGSGSAVFGVFRNPAQARRAARSFPEDTVFVCETVSREDYRRALQWKSPA
ncbi:MAG: 4-(cytidine 5'-diphospho)-2-C-methyl-D-erythritol kinase [Acidobacteria bacterium]|nr:4-(cytidine 5'-diphospho)-2-C-methyl-D-erythritol kinase [Acidobacteriota bacterium]